MFDYFSKFPILMLSWLQNGHINYIFKPLFVFNQLLFSIFFSYNDFFNDHCLQQAYFKCAYECFDRRRNHDDISNCVENCSVPVVRSQQMVENEMAKFQVSYFPFLFRHYYFYSVLSLILLVSEQFISCEKFMSKKK